MVDQFNALSVPIPATVADVEVTVNALKEKKSHFEAKQKAALEKAAKEEEEELKALANGSSSHSEEKDDQHHHHAAEEKSTPASTSAPAESAKEEGELEEGELKQEEWKAEWRCPLGLFFVSLIDCDPPQKKKKKKIKINNYCISFFSTLIVFINITLPQSP